MPKPTYSLKDILRVAEEAKQHARRNIFEGSTQLENNALAIEGFTPLINATLTQSHHQSLARAVNDVREYIKQIEPLQNALETDNCVNEFEDIIWVTSKYSLGNCHELACQALDYALYHIPKDIPAEVCYIRGGDHSFLILNRKPESNPRFPKTWGKNAVICDPWINQVYKARAYQKKLKSLISCTLFTGKEHFLNHVEPFKHNKHILTLEFGLNTDYLRKYRTVRRLKVAFVVETSALLRILNTCENNLRTKILWNKDNMAILDKCLARINAGVHELQTATSQMLETDYLEYRLAKMTLSERFSLLRKEVNHIRSLTVETIASNSPYRKSRSIKKWSDASFFAEQSGKDNTRDLRHSFVDGENINSTDQGMEVNSQMIQQSSQSTPC